ncbi:hypothetical protein [Pseudomonas indica]|jgi:hypothetical protein|uniref:Cation/multidrug efflux pump n=1 Tax=Pseudomonas indica TaxID=137658 RepID=A0A1G8WXR7_9PSED|nr:hypothetical protein [Pseudomonas indica]MBU3056129.1 hypothetical protein [Pseudomonas indica]PAU56969.1 hypothetical protein BZL42_16315 [Pseudomonas indica]SDJ82340.1 hypothetical protein SAMN05216186_1037 [Pseudomonas indica]
MQYDGLAWATALLALLVTLVAARILFNRHWFLGWLRGTCGLAFLGLAVLLGLVAKDLTAYSPLPDGKPVVTISFKAESEQRYRVTLLESGEERQVTLEGDLWQLDVRLLRWIGLADLIGLQPGYRLERLSGRFLAIEQQELAQHTQVELAQSPYGVDLWRWLRLNQRDLFLFKPEAQRVTYLPVADGAAFTVSLSPTGLLAQPMNQAATQALKDWQ